MINRKKRNIVVFGAGYVGLSVAVFLSEKNNVCIFDIDQEKIAKLLNAESPIEDTEIQKFFEMEKTRSQKQLGICSDIEEKLEDADYVIIATPTNLNHQTGHLGLDTIRQVLKDISRCSKIPVVIIKSTLPIEGCKVLQGEFPSISLFYVPEFSREGSSLLDEKNPERLIIGFSENANRREIMDISKIFLEDHKNVPVRIMNTTEAETVKLFANTYLAMRIAFFNEIDNFSVSLKLNSEKIIRGICDDSRIGNYYNIPSFGYGGYCLPKDTKEFIKNSSIYLIFNCLNFWLVRGESIAIFVQTVRELARYPLNVFSFGVQVLLTAILPFAFVAYYPSMYICQKETLPIPLIVFCTSIIIGFIAINVWKKGLRSYNSTGN